MDEMSGSAPTPGNVLSKTAGTPPSATSIEAKGIDHITDGERWGRPAGLFWLWAGAVAASTVLLHQHYLIDVVSGVALGLAGAWLLYPRWSTRGG